MCCTFWLRNKFLMFCQTESNNNFSFEDKVSLPLNSFIIVDNFYGYIGWLFENKPIRETWLGLSDSLFYPDNAIIIMLKCVGFLYYSFKLFICVQYPYFSNVAKEQKNSLVYIIWLKFFPYLFNEISILYFENKCCIETTFQFNLIITPIRYDLPWKCLWTIA